MQFKKAFFMTKLFLKKSISGLQSNWFFIIIANICFLFKICFFYIMMIVTINIIITIIICSYNLQKLLKPSQVNIQKSTIRSIFVWKLLKLKKCIGNGLIKILVSLEMIFQYNISLFFMHILFIFIY